MSVYAEVVFGLPLNQTFTYRVPRDFIPAVTVGSRVLVPFQRRQLTGFVVGIKKRKKTHPYKLRDIQEVLDEEPVFSRNFLSFTQKLSTYFYSSWGEMLQAALPPSYVLKSRTKYLLTPQGKAALADKSVGGGERHIMELLQKGSYTQAYIRKRCGAEHLSSLLRRMERKGWVEVERRVQKRVRRKGPTAPAPSVQMEMDFSGDEESRNASHTISVQLGQSAFSPYYLHAPARKREPIYFDLIKKTLHMGKKVLFLVPEISLTQTLQEKFERRLGKKVALLHSELTEKKRERVWQEIKHGRADVVVGPRSALFSPLGDLGLIIVDEEHDGSYVQTENPCYDARRGAWIRAKAESCLVLYGSSIPTVEALYRAKKRGFLVHLEAETPQKKAEVIPAKAEECILSKRVIQKIQENLQAKNQVLLFFNRRGYASFLICSRCRFIPRCVRCDAAMRYHKKEETLVCHYCGHTASRLKTCPECGSRLLLGRSFGIEMIEEELKRRFPESSVECFHTDAVRTRKEQERVLSRFKRKTVDILIGTQLLAHQKNLSPAALVICVYPEILLALPDFQAGQKTFQTLSRMRRFLQKDCRSKFLIQTSLPDHYSIRHAAVGDYGSFYRQEIRYRKDLDYPPFSHVVEVLFHSKNLRSLARESRKFSSLVKKGEPDIEIWGPALASITRMRGEFRVQTVLKAQKRKSLNAVLRKTLPRVKSKKTVFVRS